MREVAICERYATRPIWGKSFTGDVANKLVRMRDYSRL